ncbi:Glycosyltransferase involved in cell wall bisynthesis [Colwellia chukchiensis]|uniref:Glycosyltransferase involved in cell wall bisynthesis n=1 Tax=Colwellia chukchiensis TaxID=641665 RepID=A0A1H7H8Q0_9GAMM|nr:glycosyltransferase family 4 protein [Colwellia chukchiensis]SEK46654.1 Glycosyltransferase involved in cell wall bisynthesis [Colwellia chukchiensis]
MQRNVILLSNAYWPSIGGIENSLRHLAIEAQEAGDNVEIIVSDIGVPASDEDRLATVIDGIKVSRYPIAPFSHALFKPFNIVASSWQLYRLMKSKFHEQPNAIVVARFHFCAVAAILAGFASVRYLVPSIVSNQYRGEKSNEEAFLTKLKRYSFIALHSLVQKKALQRCKNFVFSETMRMQCMGLAKNKAEDYMLTKPGVDQSRFCLAGLQQRIALRRKLSLPEDIPLVLFVGRFVKAKGVDLLIEAMSKVATNCHLVLVGGGDERPAFITHIKTLGLTDKVTIVDPLRTVEDYYRCADIFVMSSRYEPLGQTLLEAFSSGLQVVAFNRNSGVNTATEELGMNNFVHYSKSLSGDALAVAVDKTLNKLNEEKRNNASKAAFEKFSWQKLYASLVD